VTMSYDSDKAGRAKHPANLNFSCNGFAEFVRKNIAGPQTDFRIEMQRGLTQEPAESRCTRE
jgi:hypothetical protein